MASIYVDEEVRKLNEYKSNPSESNQSMSFQPCYDWQTTEDKKKICKTGLAIIMISGAFALSCYALIERKNNGFDNSEGETTLFKLSKSSKLNFETALQSETVDVYSEADLEQVNNHTKTIKLFSLPTLRSHQCHSSVMTVEIMGHISLHIISKFLLTHKEIVYLFQKSEMAHTTSTHKENTIIPLKNLQLLSIENIQSCSVPSYWLNIESPLLRDVRFHNCNFEIDMYNSFRRFVNAHDSIESLEFSNCYFCKACKLRDVHFRNVRQLTILAKRDTPNTVQK